MSYVIKTTGKKSFALYMLLCDGCGYQEERSLDCRPYDSEEDAFLATDLNCPSCEGMLHRTLQGCAPVVRVKDETRDISNMKQSFHERFVKSGEMDQCRHRHGKLFDQALVSSAVKRIKERKS